MDRDLPKITDPAIIARVVALIRGDYDPATPEWDGDADLTTVYRIYSADNTLLYVGITSRQSLTRLQEHSERPWWVEGRKITLVHYPTRREALEAEAFAIQTERPLYNVLHNNGL
jgi:predicted GIY-YIG superfamily endonuclease